MARQSHILSENTEFFVKIRLISSKKQDPQSCDGLKIVSKENTGSSKIGVKIMTLVLNSLLLVSIAVPLTTQAGVFSFFSDLFSSDVEAEEVMPNSQNMALLQATISPDPKASSTKKEISILSETSLLSEAGPYSDGKDHSVNPDQISVYVVRSGDTLPAIAKMFGVSTNTIIWANDLKNGKISVGQTLVIMPMTGIQHTVKSGDTLKGIVNKYKGDLEEVMQYNDLTLNSKLVVGDVIFIPDGDYISTPTKSNSGSSGTKSNTPSYSGYYLRPIIGGIKTQGIHGNNSVDLSSTYGSKIMASADGIILVAKSGGWNGGYGSYIVIKHGNGTQTLYAHLSGVAVSVGENVSQGQTIGYMGNSGKVSGPTGTHLHFEIRGARNPF